MARILVIDDSDVMRQLLSEFLGEEGFEVDCTQNSLEGITLALSNKYDICICDMHLAARSGLEVFCEVSAKKPALPFIITDSLPDHQSEKGRTDGAYWYLKKPFELDHLREIIRKITRPVRVE